MCSFKLEYIIVVLYLLPFIVNWSIEERDWQLIVRMNVNVSCKPELINVDKLWMHLVLKWNRYMSCVWVYKVSLDSTDIRYPWSCYLSSDNSVIPNICVFFNCLWCCQYFVCRCSFAVYHTKIAIFIWYFIYRTNVFNIQQRVIFASKC